MKNMINREFIKKMAIIVLMAIIGLTMTACSGGDDGGGNGDSDDGGGTESGDNSSTGGITNGDIAKDAPINTGSIDTSTTLVFDKMGIYYDNNTYKDVLYSISDYVPGTTITVKDGKLNMKLGTPKTEYLQLGSSQLPSSDVTMNPSDVKSFLFEKGFYTSDENYKLSIVGPTNYSNDPCFAILFYAEKGGTVNGTYIQTGENNYSYTMTFNMSINKGWNYQIQERQQNSNKITCSQTLPSGYSWVISNN